MARTAAGAALSVEHRRRQVALRAALLRDVTTLWRVVDPTDLTATFSRFSTAAAIIVRARYGESAGLAAGYYAAFRMAEGIAGTATPVLGEPPAATVVSEALRATGLVGILNARRAGQSVQAAAQNGLVRASGSATSLVLAGARDTILGTAAQDKARPRWQRITSDEPCAFCAMLASRGAVYSSEETSSFEAHDHCSCMVEPVYPGSAMPATALAFRERWEQATSGLSGADALDAFRSAIEGRD